ncbi:MAG: hypothetical protein NC299_02535 [Lachnospiraceae bacterium]|nr:hypothetical protein [Ruminococcus sp.]MCM1274227.1 hypothetical protein [Lachnospiraceae bacterium]
MTRDNIEAQCLRISANYESSGFCRFVRGGGVLCFIDTSQARNGTRGIAFKRDAIIVCLGRSEPREIAFSSIRDVHLISSFEDFYADELLIVCDDCEVRISDYSLDKFELKRFIEELSVESEKAREHRAQAEEYAKIIAERLAQSTLREERAPRSEPFVSPSEKPSPAREDEKAEGFGEEDDFIPEEGEPVIRETVVEIPTEKVVTVPEDHDPVPIPEEKIKWISGSFYTKSKVIPEETPVIAASDAAEEDKRVDNVNEPEEDGAFEPIVLYSRGEEESPLPKPEWLELVEAIEENRADGIAESNDDDDDDGGALVQIQNMSREETLSFLAESLSEINGVEEAAQSDNDGESGDDDKDGAEEPFDIGADLKTISESSAPPEVEENSGGLTVEPIWGDIYIKASRNLRELIEDGRLSMEQIETELRDKLLGSARAFAEITADEAKVPKVLMPRITELKNAAGDFDEYFKSGEDIAVRAMFFMMYQMLSYADRIAETPETKERLNDFFRRFGPAGITLSMLDMRV